MTTLSWKTTLRRASARIRHSMQHIPNADRSDALYEAVALWLTRTTPSLAPTTPLVQESDMMFTYQHIPQQSAIVLLPINNDPLPLQQIAVAPVLTTISTADPAAWLTVVARRLLLNRWKVKGREVLFSSLGNSAENEDAENERDFGNSEDCVGTWDIQHDYAMALAAMSDTLRESFTLYLEGYTSIEIAARLNLSPEVAKKRIQRARIFMQHYLHEYAA